MDFNKMLSGIKCKFVLRETTHLGAVKQRYNFNRQTFSRTLCSCIFYTPKSQKNHWFSIEMLENLLQHFHIHFMFWLCEWTFWSFQFSILFSQFFGSGVLSLTALEVILPTYFTILPGLILNFNWMLYLNLVGNIQAVGHIIFGI